MCFPRAGLDFQLHQDNEYNETCLPSVQQMWLVCGQESSALKEEDAVL